MQIRHCGSICNIVVFMYFRYLSHLLTYFSLENLYGYSNRMVEFKRQICTNRYMELSILSQIAHVESCLYVYMCSILCWIPLMHTPYMESQLKLLWSIFFFHHLEITLPKVQMAIDSDSLDSVKGLL